MMIVAGISNAEEVNELVSITKSFVVANRAKQLVHELKKE
jgi:hypothetical protein